MKLTKEDYDYLARACIAAAQEAEEILGEFLPAQRILIAKLFVEALLTCLDCYGPQGQDHHSEMKAGYGRLIKILKSEGETLRNPDNPQGPQSPSLGPLGD